MLIQFNDKYLENLYTSCIHVAYPPGIIKKFIMRVTQIKSAGSIDLYNLNGLYIDKLTGQYSGQLGIDLNDTWRFHVKMSQIDGILQLSS